MLLNTFPTRRRIPGQQTLRHRDLSGYSFTWDLVISRNKDIIYCSPNCQEITGYPPRLFLENIGHLEAIIHPDDRDRDPVKTVHRSIDNRFQCNEYRIVDSTGEVKWMAAFLRPILLEGKNLMGTLISNLDITPYRENLARIKKKNNMLQRRNDELIEQLSNAFVDIEKSETKVVAHNKALRKTNRELLDANKALKVLAKNLDTIKSRTEAKLLDDIHKTIYPLATELKNAKNKIDLRRSTENLLFRLKGLCRVLGEDGSSLFKRGLSPTETKVAVLIREGLSSKRIAENLKISVATVKTHRKNIRKKLKLQHSSINLVSYLKLNWFDQVD
jgi:PAS domain S-box-containing protein